MLQHVRKYLLQAVDDIDAGNSNIPEEDEIRIAKVLKEMIRMDAPMSKYQAYTFLNMSRAQFDNLVREGKIPRGKKISGWKELRWYKKDLIKLKKELKQL